MTDRAIVWNDDNRWYLYVVVDREGGQRILKEKYQTYAEMKETLAVCRKFYDTIKSTVIVYVKLDV